MRTREDQSDAVLKCLCLLSVASSYRFPIADSPRVSGYLYVSQSIARFEYS